MVAHINSLAPSVAYLAKSIVYAVYELEPLAERVVRLASFFIPIGIDCYFCAYGAAEITCDFTASKLDGQDCPKGGTAAYFLYEKVKEFLDAVPFGKVHGTLFLAIAAAQTLKVLHYLDYISVADLLGPLSLGCETAFIAANVLMLMHNFKIYYHASSLPHSLALEQQIFSAMAGIFSSFNYIIGAALVTAGAEAAVVIFFMILGLSGGSVKVLYDFAHSKYGCAQIYE